MAAKRLPECNEEPLIKPAKFLLVEDKDTHLDSDLKKMQSVFAKQNITFVVEGEELHVDRTELIEKSPVFRKMLESDFKEKHQNKINLPEKKLKHFVKFLRCTLSGIEDEITVSVALCIIPLAHEYQVDTVLEKAENVLVKSCKERGCEKQRSDEVIQNILFAQKYNLENFLKNLIDIASRKVFSFFSAANGYNSLTKETLYEIAMKRWENNINPIDGSNTVMSLFSANVKVQ